MSDHDVYPAPDTSDISFNRLMQAVALLVVGALSFMVFSNFLYRFQSRDAAATFNQDYTIGSNSPYIISNICSPAHVVLDKSTLPKGSEGKLTAMAEQAVRVLDDNGAKLVFDGTFNPSSTSRLGKGAASPIIISFTSRGTPKLRSEDVGETSTDTDFQAPWKAAWIHVDTSWVLGDYSIYKDGAPAPVPGVSGPGNSSALVAGVLGHELLHALGLGHARPGELMGVSISPGAFLTQGDIEGIKALYGKCGKFTYV